MFMEDKCIVEHERSYIFTHEGAEKFLAKYGSDLSNLMIEDYYLGQGRRVRKSYGIDSSDKGLNIKDISYVFTRKTGDKAKGYRFEFEESITKSLAESLMKDAVMVIKKKRKRLLAFKLKSEYSVTMDFIEEPMKLAILEIEANNQIVYPVSADITKHLFGVVLKECPFCSYGLFNRHFAIVGAPASGKSETAKILSHILNTTYQANSFHVVEFATTFIQKYKKTPSFWEEFFIWHGQHEREHLADLANIIISDCPTFLTYIYLLHLPKSPFSSDTALALAKMYKRVLFDIDWYSDIIFLKLKNYKENRIRYQSQEEALVIEKRIKGFLDDHNICYSTYDYSQSEQILKDLFYINS